MSILNSQSWEDWGQPPSASPTTSSGLSRDPDDPSEQSRSATSHNNGALSRSNGVDLDNTEKSQNAKTRSKDSASAISSQNKNKNAEDQAPPRRKRGRPRKVRDNEEVCIQERRLQIRRAQQTHRLKKETTISNLQRRVAELEGVVGRMGGLFFGLRDGVLSSEIGEVKELVMDVAERGLEEGRRVGVDVDDGSGIGGREGKREGEERMVLGYQVPKTSHTQVLRTERNCTPLSPSYSLPSPYFLQPESHLSTTTYSYLESSFSRRLHRYCLEHAYRCFSNPASDPNIIYRIFRLVSCIRDREKMEPYFQSLLKSGPEESLEIWSLPFYRIGGAGTHYPRNDGFGNPVYPPNMRLPKRVLGSLPVSRAEIPDQGEESGGPDMLGVMGFGGDWFDSHDVEKYLEEKGIFIDGYTSFVEVGELTGVGISREVGGEEVELGSHEKCHFDDRSSSSSVSPSSSLVLDIERFLNSE
ncbi:hypothetical protein FQN54_003045 [Arachnomyces sp. PD_36]|nr:hypothetical protein FQN54_003045 [Arachnomyces sp. PD_36]